MDAVSDYDQPRLLDTDSPYYLDHRAYCDVWEVRARRGGSDWGLKQFSSRRKAAEALAWLEADYAQSGEVRRQYPKGAPHWRHLPER